MLKILEKNGDIYNHKHYCDELDLESGIKSYQSGLIPEALKTAILRCVICKNWKVWKVWRNVERIIETELRHYHHKNDERIAETLPQMMAGISPSSRYQKKLKTELNFFESIRTVFTNGFTATKPKSFWPGLALGTVLTIALAVVVLRFYDPFSPVPEKSIPHPSQLALKVQLITPKLRSITEEDGIMKLKTGGLFKIEIGADRKAYIYILRKDPNDRIIDVLGNGAERNSPVVEPGTTFNLPAASDNYYTLQGPAGLYTYFVVASTDPISDFSEKIQNVYPKTEEELKRLFPNVKIDTLQLIHVERQKYK